MKIIPINETTLDPKLFGEYVVRIDNVLWSTKYLEQMKYDEAVNFASKYKVALPTKKEIEKMLIINRIFPILDLTKPFWSASVFSINRSLAWIFSGDYGVIVVAFRDVTYSVRCVQHD